MSVPFEPIVPPPEPPLDNPPPEPEPILPGVRTYSVFPETRTGGLLACMAWPYSSASGRGQRRPITPVIPFPTGPV